MKTKAIEFLKENGAGGDLFCPKGSVAQLMADFASSFTPITDEVLIEMLKQISEWVNKENQFMPLEYVGLLKEWLSNKSILSHPSDAVEALRKIMKLLISDYDRETVCFTVDSIYEIKAIAEQALQDLPQEKGTK